MKQGLVIFSGYNQRAIIAFMRVLEKYENVKYHIFAASDNDPIFMTSYSKHIFWVRRNKLLNYDELAEAFLNLRNNESYDNIIVAPSTEALNRFFLEKRESFAGLKVFMPIVDRSLYEEISDKESFWFLCRKKGMPVPEKMAFPDKFTKKFVAKPKTYVSTNGKIYSPVLITNDKEFYSFKSDYDVSMFDIQEYIEGKSYYLLYYFDSNGKCLKYSQKNIAQQSGGKSILIAESSDIHTRKISTCYEALLLEKQYRGFVMIELRENNGTFYMIEANPRFWGPSQLHVDAGVLFFDHFLMDCKLIDNVIEEPNCIARYVWSTGFHGDIIDDDDARWYENKKESVCNELEAWLKWDVYRREDTITIFELEKQ